MASRALLLRWAERASVSTHPSPSSMLHICSTGFWVTEHPRLSAAGRLKNCLVLNYSGREGLFGRAAGRSNA